MWSWSPCETDFAKEGLGMNDFLEGCISDISGNGPKDYGAFQETFCKRCRNGDCKHAKWASDQFTARITTQVDRFFHNPNQADQRIPKYAQIPDFANLLREAITLEIADRKGDWSIPGQEEHLPAIPALILPKDEELPPIREEDFPVEEEPMDVPEPVVQPEPVDSGVPVEMPKKVGGTPPAVPGNTPKREGIILPGGPTGREPLKAAVDPWAPVERIEIVKPGATVTMGGKK